MKFIFGFGFALLAELIVPETVSAQDNGEACIRLESTDTLAWRRFRSDIGIVSEISLTNRSDWVELEQGITITLDGADFWGFLLRGKSTGCLKPIRADHASIVDACRDPFSGRIHAVLHTGSGQHFDLRIWSTDPATGEPVQEYAEGWTDSYEDAWPGLYARGAWNPVAPDGRCQWRERQATRKMHDDALQALRVNAASEEAAELHEVNELPVRRLDSETIRHWLMSLEGTATIEGAAYASDEDRANWRVVQIRGNALCDAYGTVLVLNRGNDQWHSVYDVQSGCSKSLDFPLRGMRVNDGHLIFAACTGCSGFGDYDNYSVDLETWKVRRLDAREESKWNPHSKQNPRLRDVRQEVFGDP